MYKVLASHIYLEGYIYSGPAVECYYSFYTSKDFDPKDVANNIIEQSQVGAAGEGATMLTTEAFVDESGSNNLYAVRFNAYGPGLSSTAGIDTGQIPWGWILAIILAAIIAFTVVYTVRTVREISYSPSGKAMWGAFKWVGISIAVLAGAYLINRFLPRRARSGTSK